MIPLKPGQYRIPARLSAVHELPPTPDAELFIVADTFAGWLVPDRTSPAAASPTARPPVPLPPRTLPPALVSTPPQEETPAAKAMRRILSGPDAHKVRGTAYHEAGHAVACVDEGLALYEVAVLYSGPVGQEEFRGCGRCVHEGRGSAVVCLAGPAAEARAGFGTENLTSSGGDWRAAAERASYREVYRADARAKTLVRKQWGAVDALATEILRIGSVKGPEAERIIRRRWTS